MADYLYYSLNRCFATRLRADFRELPYTAKERGGTDDYSIDAIKKSLGP
jgi:hypothetical protein